MKKKQCVWGQQSSAATCSSPQFVLHKEFWFMASQKEGEGLGGSAAAFGELSVAVVAFGFMGPCRALV